LINSLKNARQILSTAKQNYPVLMVSPPPTSDEERHIRIKVLFEHFSTLCQELTIRYLDVFNPLLNSPIWISEVKAGDGSHPNAAGYEELAQLVQNWSAWSNWFKPNNFHSSGKKR